MATYLIDTNIFVRIADPKSKKSVLALEALTTLENENHLIFINSQILTEFWSVATRPLTAYGLGLDIETVYRAINDLTDQFPLLTETSSMFSRWLQLVSEHHISGKRVHDARLLALMLEYSITHLLTLNAKDFPNVDGITIVDPLARS